MIKIYHKPMREQRLSELADFKIGSWLYVEDPSEDELNRLVEEFHLDRGLLHDALDPNEVPRLEHTEGVTYVFTRAPLREENRVITVPLLLGVGENFVFTVSKKELSFLGKFFAGRADFYTTQKSKLFTQIIAELNLSYEEFLREISHQVRAITLRIEKIQNREIIQFVTHERVLNDFLAVLFPTNRILQSLLSSRYFKLYEEDEELTQDVFLANGQLIESAKSNLQTIVNFREAYSTIMTNNLNRVIKILTALTVVLTIPTMIASFYGMNVPLPFQESPLAFLVLLATATVISLLALTVFLSSRWL